MFCKKFLTSIILTFVLMCSHLSAVKAGSGNSLENFDPGYFLSGQAGIHQRVALGYNFNPYFALEGGAGYIHPILWVITSLSYADIFTFDVSAKATLPLEMVSSFFTGWNLYAKAGPAILAGKVKRVLLFFETNDNVSGLIPYGAIGLGYNFNKHLGLDFVVSILGPAVSLTFRF